jgi:tetratricopeptide (TPR) repeat protein
MKSNFLLNITVFALLIASCSTAPKNPGDIYDLRGQGENALAQGNREASKGNYEMAILLLNDSLKKAQLTDDTGLMIRCNLSRANVLYSLGRTEEAFSVWEKAVSDAQEFGSKELLSVSRVYLARGKLAAKTQSAKEVFDEVNREQSNIRNDKLYIAFAWYVSGSALRELGSYKEAEAAVKNSLDIHARERNLEDAAYDWYTIASIRSLDGNYPAALEALQSALELDRRVENSWGIAADWRAMGDVYKKAGNTAEARNAYLRAREVFSAMGKDNEAAEIDKKLGLL